MLEKLQNHTVKPIRRGHKETQMNCTPESEECFPGEKGPNTGLIPGTASAGEENPTIDIVVKNSNDLLIVSYGKHD